MKQNIFQGQLVEHVTLSFLYNKQNNRTFPSDFLTVLEMRIGKRGCDGRGGFGLGVIGTVA